VSFDASILVIMAIFWVTYFILRVCFFKPMVALLEEREGRVTTAQQTWDQAFAETQKSLEEERVLLAETRRKAMNARAERRREAQEHRLETLAEVKKSVQQELAQASTVLEGQVSAERETLAQRARGLADQIVERLLSATGKAA
jgi:F0F1-type ATP synthase membrane subunit b/b'